MKKSFILLSFFFVLIISLFLNIYKKDSSPPGFNADEAAFGYNAYSLFKTGRDEYGTFLPLRLKSFGDYKMPLYSYLSVPFIAFLGPSETSTRMLNTFLAVLFPLIIFFLCKELFESTPVGIIASFLLSTSLGMNIVGRHAHEAYLATFLIALASLFYVRFIKRKKTLDEILFFIALFLSLFAYQSSRIFAGYFFLYTLGEFISKKKFNYKFLTIFILLILLFLSTDLINKPERVKNLFFTNTAGFSLNINELRGEGGNIFAYNKFSIGARDIILKQLSYFSPDFLVVNGDENNRFGYPLMSPMTPIEYIAIFIGCYYLFRNKSRWRYFLLFIVIIAPLPASLTWGSHSLTRTLFLFIPLLIISAYGIWSVTLIVRKIRIAYLILIGGIIIILHVSFLYYAWDFYLNHYPKRIIVQESWQTGYRGMAQYIYTHNNSFDKFYITKKRGQPYIFLLFYLHYPPLLYQSQAMLSAPDEYGFGQVNEFAKYNFNFINNVNEKHIALIGYPDDFNDGKIDKTKVKKIKDGSKDIFWIYER